MPNSRYDLLRGYNFFVEVNGIEMSFSRVSGLGKGATLEPVQEGGNNSRIQYLRGPIEEQTLTLEYGVTTDVAALNTLTPGRYLPKGVFICAMNDAFEQTKNSYSLSGCYIKKVNFGEFNASGSQLVIHSLEISYDHMLYGA